MVLCRRLRTGLRRRYIRALHPGVVHRRIYLGRTSILSPDVIRPRALSRVAIRGPRLARGGVRVLVALVVLIAFPKVRGYHNRRRG